MPLTSPKELLADAYRNRYAVAAFAAHNMEMMRAVVEAAEEAGAPVILQTTPATLRYAGLESIVAMARAAAEGAKVPVALHLDHGDTFETVVRCLRAGYTSVMVDASRLPFLENAAFVAKVTEAAHAAGVPVEAELGTIGGAEEGGAGEEELTDPEAAEEFVRRTGIDFLAPAFGTVHGVYKGEIRLDFSRLEAISRRVGLPLVMHGASGVPGEMIRRAIARGVSKVNFSTELKRAFVRQLRNYLSNHPEETDPRRILLPAREAVKQIAKRKIEIVSGVVP
ncbi:fructose-bisphosphate aldolase, class II [Planifilum fulgidum]|uniref:Fructose-bisphosphate aldolase, class II n=1 Tax=Planifilum fulgidum TaxID=201973 RepID=A0A1I2MXK1_9BACL|nr:class II fructose-bisphosphate aldolase [Planifilum fulgidum]MBO2497083.1 ketose-bisphosphate aldolase [Bacillota bacterium]MBO2533342.1 ketose-bisphosphate aldolase [Thermoactinomycetaceae bacterium]SFF96212.1 fructose-bisphosphate aldolase, class II [Planifilum fulgidum]